MNPFVAILIMFVPIFLFFGLINYFIFRNWSLFYTALDENTYFRVVNQLKRAGIRLKTKSLSQANTMTQMGVVGPSYYEIYVKKQDVHKANQALRP